jgi:hypothetical protein
VNQPTKGSHEILSKPLPQILDEIDGSIIRAEQAAADARKAAEEARRAGEEAAEAVMKKIRNVFNKMVEDITTELATHENKPQK